MNAFYNLAVRCIARNSSLLSGKVSTCLTSSRAHLLINKCGHYQWSMSTRGYAAVCWNNGHQLKASHDCQSGLPSHNNSPFGMLVRHKSRGHNNPHVKSAQKRKQKEDASVEDDEDSDEEEEDEAEGEVWDKHFDEDDDFPQRCKEMKKRVNSLRCDALVSAGLAMSRRKIEEAFLSSQLYINGEKVLKVGKKASEGDYIDLLEKEDGEAKVKRVRLVKVVKVDGQEKSEVYLRCWRAFIVTDQYS